MLMRELIWMRSECMYVPGEDVYKVEQDFIPPSLHKTRKSVSEPSWEQQNRAKRLKVRPRQSIVSVKQPYCSTE